MSSEPHQHGIYLVVRYYGAKAAQHFSKEFTAMSSSIFRQDLSTMKFPHPKVINTRLAHNATVTAWWPGVSYKTHDMLCGHLKRNTTAASNGDLLSNLSILLLHVMEIGEEGQEPVDLAFARNTKIQRSSSHSLPPPAKRARLDGATHSAIPVPRPHLTSFPSTVPPTTALNVSQFRPGAPPPALLPVPQNRAGTTFTAQKRTWDGRTIPSTLPAKPPISSNAPFLPQTLVRCSTSLPNQQAPAPSTPVRGTKTLPPKPSTGPQHLSQNITASAVNGQDTLATQLKFQASVARGLPLGISTHQRVPVPPSQVLGQQIIPNHPPTQSSLVQISMPAITHSQDLHRGQASSSIDLGRLASPKRVPTISVKGTHNNPLKPSSAPVSSSQNTLTANAMLSAPTQSVYNAPGVHSTQPAPTGRGISATPSVSNSLSVPQSPPEAVARIVPTAQAVSTSSSAAPRPLTSPVQTSQITHQTAQTHQPTQPSQSLISTPDKSQTRQPVPHNQRQSTCPPSFNQSFNGDELEALRERVKSMEEMLQIQSNVKVRLDETTDKLQEEQEARKKLEETAVAAQEKEAEAAQHIEELQDLLEEEGRRRSEADDLLTTTRRDALSYREMYDQAKKERDQLAHGYNCVQDELSISHRKRGAVQEELDRVLQKLEQMEQETQDEADRRRLYQDRLASAQSNEAALKEHYDDALHELAALRRMRDRDAQDAIAAKRRDDEALRRADEKLRTQQIVIQQAEGVVQSVQSSEKALRRRLEEVESKLEEIQSCLGAELEAEKRLRREAEDAIADIRRECREPFVVPSLLDAFVELAKLTTAATTSNTLAVGTDEGDLDNKNLGRSHTTDSGIDVANGDSITMDSSTELTHKQLSPLSPCSPWSPQFSAPSLQRNALAPRRQVSDSTDAAINARSPERQVKLEFE